MRRFRLKLDEAPDARFDERMEKSATSKLLTPILQILMAVAITLAALIAPAEADTLARVMPFANQAVITVFKGRISGDNHDGSFLFDSMNVPAQDGMLGPGKAIKDSSQILSWVCGDKGQDGFQCTFMIQKNARTEIHQNPVRVSYRARGAEAQALSKLVVPNEPDGTFKFINREGTIKILATDSEFSLHYAE